jgi:hypothetical protein
VAAGPRVLAEKAGVAVGPRSPAAEGAALQPRVAAAAPDGQQPAPGATVDVRAPGWPKEAAGPHVGRAAGLRASAAPAQLVPSSRPEDAAASERPRVMCALGPVAALHWA